MLSASLLYKSFEGIKEETEAYTIVSFPFVNGKLQWFLEVPCKELDVVWTLCRELIIYNKTEEETLCFRLFNSLYTKHKLNWFP